MLSTVIWPAYITADHRRRSSRCLFHTQRLRNHYCHYDQSLDRRHGTYKHVHSKHGPGACVVSNDSTYDVVW
jgi:signal recognition particle subunit SEC65